MTRVRELVAALLATRNGAAAQRAAYSRRNRVDDVLTEAVDATIAT